MVYLNLLERTHFWDKIIDLGSSPSEPSVTHAGKISAAISQSRSNCPGPRNAFPMAGAMA